MQRSIVEKEIYVKRLTLPSIFKLIAIGNFISMMIFCLVMGLFAWGFNANTIRWNNHPVPGLKGFLISPLLGLFLSAMFTVIIGAFIATGLWLYGCFSEIKLTCLVYDDEQTPLPAIAQI